MVTRTFTKATYTLKGVTANDEMKSISFALWDFEIPSGKRALNALFAEKCKENGMELFKAVLDSTTSEVRGVSEAEFFKSSVRVDR